MANETDWTIKADWLDDRRCPECGSMLLSNGEFVWCSFVGSQRPQGEKPCSYGLRERVRLEDLPAVASPPDPGPRDEPAAEE